MKYNFDEIINRKKTDSLKWDHVAKITNGKEVLPLWVADTDFKAPIEVIESLKERVEHGIFGYSSFSETYNNTIKEWIKKRHGWNIKEEWITFSPGIVPAISFAVQSFSEEGDGILIQTPVYGPFHDVPESLNRKLLKNHLILKNNKFSIDFDDFKEKAKEAKIFILCNPHNPSGRVLTKNELEKLGQICLEEDVLIISDEIHSDIIYSGNKHISISSLSKELEQITITCMAPSKTFSLAGLATSAIIIPNEKNRNKFDQILIKNDISSNIFGKVALEAAYKYGEEYVDQLTKYLEDNRNYLLEYFEKHIKNIKPIKIEGTYLVWLDCTKLGLEGDELKNFFIEAGVGLNPGTRFGQNGKSFMRLNIGCPREILSEGVKKIRNAVEKRYNHE